MQRILHDVRRSATATGDLGLIDNTFASAEGAAGTATPKTGYVFTVLTSQGASATGGARQYMVNGKMTLGYALNAVPGSYDGTGRNQFMINNNGTNYQSDQGNSTQQTLFDPNTGWTPTE